MMACAPTSLVASVPSRCAAVFGTMAEAGHRQRYAGTHRELANTIGGAIRSRGRSFLDYDEAETTSKSRTDATKIKEAMPLLLALREADANMNFKKTTLRECIKILLNDFEADDNWQLRQEDVGPYLRIMTNRVSNLVFTVKQAEGRHPECKWVASLPWRADKKQDPRSSSAASKGPTTTEYIYGHDKELGRAWRSTTTTGKRAPLKDFADEMLNKGGKLWASWQDGGRWEVSGLSISEFEDGAPRKRQVSDAGFWAGVHAISHNLLSVRFRKDRHPMGLVSLFEQKRQILQVMVKDFGGNVEAASKFMCTTAELYAENRVPREKLKAYAKKRMLDDGWSQTRGNKRPSEAFGDHWASLA